MVIWKAHYTDEHHDLDIDILNTEEEYASDPLSFCIDGIAFSGTSLGDFHLSDPAMYERAKKEFHILKQGGNQITYSHPSQIPYSYDLQRYSLDVRIPISLFKKDSQQTIQGNLQIYLKYCEHDIASAVFTLCVDGKEYSVDNKELYFEDSLLRLSRMIGEEYSLKCCFTCQYSDYSPYGNDDYGTMLCYRHHKDAYLKVHDKASYFQYAEGLDHETRQETYCREEYEPRTKCEGYRGFVE